MFLPKKSNCLKILVLITQCHTTLLEPLLKMKMVSCGLVVFTIILTGGFYIYSMLWGLDGELSSMMDDPTIPVTLLIMAICAYFTFKENIIAATSKVVPDKSYDT